MAERPSRYLPRKEPLQQRSRRTRARILSAAAHVFADGGYASTTTDLIASTARVSIGSLYQYFPNKDAILLALTLDHLERSAEAIRTHLAESAAAAHPLERWLAPLVAAIVRDHAADPALHKVLFEEAPRSAELVTRLREVEHDTVQAIASLLHQDAGLNVQDPHQAGRMIVATAESVIHWFVTHDPGAVKAGAVERDITAMLSAYLRGPAPV